MADISPGDYVEVLKRCHCFPAGTRGHVLREMDLPALMRLLGAPRQFYCTHTGDKTCSNICLRKIPPEELPKDIIVPHDVDRPVTI